MITWLDGKIVEKKQWCEGLFSLKIKTEPLAFIAGQFVIIGLDHNGERIHKPYSLVNSPDDKLLEVHFNTVHDGQFSPLLTALEPGDAVYISNRPSGLLTLNEVPAGRRHLWLCATGTGIGPFLSLLRTDEPWQRFEKIIVCYSSKTRDDMAYFADFQALVEQNPEQFDFVPFVTREDVADTFHTRITNHIENGKLEDYVGVKFSPESSHVMLCGNSNMLDDVTKLLEQKGLQRHSRSKPGHIAIEKYF